MPITKTKTKGKEPLEKDIQKQILEYMDLTGWFFWRSNNGSTYNPFKKGFQKKAKYAINGVPDIIAIRKGQFVGIEVKRKGRDLSEDQKTFKEMCVMFGGIYIMVHSLDEFRTFEDKLLYETTN